ncbi:MAG: hydantoinase/oxoprolinase family protein, partial [Candidatus Omnitrophica bacterium]|nr:hydantoinase/oxoprolinase family protein [Candidatus Omnitrophota bacterium]
MPYIVGVDIGGTFTDCVVADSAGALTIGKALSTPRDFSAGVINSLRDAALNLGLQNEVELIQSTKLFFHACTIGDNTLITRSGSQTGLITTEGFADTILMMRGKITDGLTEAEAAHVPTLSKPDPIVPRPLIEEVNERVDYKGTVLVKLDASEIETVIQRLVAKGVEAIAVCLLWSVSNDSHEKIIGDVLKEKYPSMFFSLSSEVAPFLGEYERTATTVINTYIGSKITAYLSNLRNLLKANGLPGEPLIMQAYGGVLGIEATSKNAVGTIESGPASGVVGTQFLGTLTGDTNILATDMGGTTFKVSVIRDGIIERDYKPLIIRHHILSTKIWVESIGAGGGSVAWIDPETALLKVGPHGAGAAPGPVCYGLGGTEPTVSDADLVLGYLNEEYFLGGRMKLNKKKALEAITEKIAKPLKINPIDAASGIYRIANAHLGDLIRKATVEKGHDPRNFVLFAFGGAGPVHVGRYAAELGIKRVIVPLTASVHGATGLISSDVVYEYGKSDRLLAPADLQRINANFHQLVSKAYRDLGAAGFPKDSMQIRKSVDMRYRYQIHELNVPFPAATSEISEQDMEDLYSRFDELYEKSFGQGSGYREAGTEILTFRVTAIGELKRPEIKRYTIGQIASHPSSKGKRNVYFDDYGDFVETPVYDFQRLSPGEHVSG